MYTYSQHQFLKSQKVAGVRLHPFTLGHADVLCGLGSPLYRGETPDLPDMALALFVCSRPWRKARRQIRSGRAQRELSRLGRRFGKMEPEQAGAVVELLQDYVATYNMSPPRWEDGGEKSAARTPWHLAVFCMIQDKTNLTPADVWGLPVARAFELCAVIGANHGDDKLMTDAEMKIQELLENAPNPVEVVEPVADDCAD